VTQAATDLLPAKGERRIPEPMLPPVVDIDGLLARHSFSWRCQAAGLMIDGDKFDAKAFPFLVDMYDEPPHPSEVIQKGAQLGVTAWAINSTIERMRDGTYPRGVLYGFPTQEEVYDFSQARFDKILRDNPEFFAGAVRSTDRTELKEIGTGMLYFRGIRQPDKSKRPSKLLSFPVDRIVLDEHDDMDPNAIAIVLSRLDSSLIRHLLRLGHPTVPEFGIAALYAESDQRRWLIKCRGCNEYTCLEDEFPHCIGRVKGGDWFRCCRRCKREIFVVDGAWIAKYTERTSMRGRLMSQLLSTRKPLSGIVAHYEQVCADGRNEAAFWNLVLAKPFVSLDNALELEFVLSLCNAEEPQRDAFHGPSFLGADVGARKIYVSIGHHPGTESRDQVHWAGEIESFDELFDLGKRHNVECGVIDKMAETRSVVDFTKRAWWAWGARYTEDHNADPTWHGEEREVKIGRTSSLDGSHRAIVDRHMVWPRRSQYLEETYGPQLVNLVRVDVHTPRTEKTGERRFAWHVRGVKNDHHRHGVNYMRVAGARVGIARAPDSRRRRSESASVNHWQSA
jgi:hypothetical protein